MTDNGKVEDHMEKVSLSIQTALTLKEVLSMVRPNVMMVFWFTQTGHFIEEIFQIQN